MMARLAFARRTTLLASAAAMLVCAGPARGEARFLPQEPIWTVADTTPIDAPAANGWNRYQQFVDGYWRRPIDDALALRTGAPASDLNAIEEVPASSWFSPRNGRTPLDADAVGRGNAAGLQLPAGGGLQVRVARVTGAEPFMEIVLPDGRTAMLEFDDPAHPEMRTAAAVISARLLHAAGYHVLPAFVANLRPADFALAADAAAIDVYGRRSGLTEAGLAAFWSRLGPEPIRAAVSLLPPALVLGPTHEVGTRPDDANDRIPHEDRRSLRGLQVLCAWLGHARMRPDRTLDLYLTEDRCVRHCLTGLASSLGARAAAPHPFGTEEHEAYWAMGTWSLNILALGLGRTYPAREMIAPFTGVGLFDARDFDPQSWRPAYGYAPFQRATWADLLWGAGLVAGFSDEQIRAAVAAGELSLPEARDFLAGVLGERRDRIAGSWLRDLNGATGFRIEIDGDDPRACRLAFADLALVAGAAQSEDFYYTARLERPELGQVIGEQSRGGRQPRFDLSAAVPERWRHRSDPARYLVARVESYDHRGHPRAGAARVHVYFPPEGRPQVVGVERN